MYVYPCSSYLFRYVFSQDTWSDLSLLKISFLINLLTLVYSSSAQVIKVYLHSGYTVYLFKYCNMYYIYLLKLSIQVYLYTFTGLHDKPGNHLTQAGEQKLCSCGLMEL
jgi:hypothetical protein